MDTQKMAILETVEEARRNGRRVGDVLATLGINRATYYRWKKGASHGFSSSSSSPRVYPVLPEEQHWIDEVKAAHPTYRHRRIQGVLQASGRYVSASTIYLYLKKRDQVEPYIRREAPWKQPRYEIRHRNLLWGSDWTRLSIGYVRWYLLTIIDFFSRYLIAFAVVPTVNASHVQAIYRQGLRAQGIPLHAAQKPELRVDRGSPNMAWVTQAFFQQLGADLSFARVRRPTDNAITERFYGSLKQEEVYVVGNYPDETAAHQEIGQYIDHYNHHRPHQALMNFKPAYVHQVNNKTRLVQERQVLKQAARDRRRAYWLQTPEPLQDGETNEGLGLDQGAIVESRANMEDDLKNEKEQKFTFQQEGETSPTHDSPHTLILSH
jgi:transposase InsO family protein